MTRKIKSAIRPTERCICHELRRLTRLVTAHYDHILAPSGLRITQFSILAQIDALGSVTVSKLARLMASDSTTVLRNINSLIRQNLVKVAVGADKRERIIALTPKGRASLQGAFNHWRRAQESFRNIVGTEGAIDLLRAIKRTAPAFGA